MLVIPLAMVWAVLWLLALAAALLLLAGLRHRFSARYTPLPSARRPRQPASTPEPAANPPPPGDRFSLSCPHCDFTGPLDDIQLVGETVDCPLCEQPFLVLEPLPANTSA